MLVAGWHAQLVEEAEEGVGRLLVDLGPDVHVVVLVQERRLEVVAEVVEVDRFPAPDLVRAWRQAHDQGQVIPNNDDLVPPLERCEADGEHRALQLVGQRMPSTPRALDERLVVGDR